MATPRQLKFKILWKLYNHNYWGRRHTPRENIPKGIPSHERGVCLEIVSDLVKEGLLLRKKTKHGVDVSLNPRMVAEIRRYLETFDQHM